MAENTDIFDGTVSVTTGTKAVTGVGTLWLSAGIQSGDLFGSDGHPRARIDTVNSNTSITLKDNWRGPTLAAGSAYWIRYQADSSRYSALLGQVRKMLSQASVSALSALTGVTDKIPYFIDANTMGLADFKSWARSLFGLTMAADKLPYGTGANTMGLTDFTAAGRASVNIIGTAAADKLAYFTGASGSAITDFTTTGRAVAGAANAGAALSAIGGYSTSGGVLIGNVTIQKAFPALIMTLGSSSLNWNIELSSSSDLRFTRSTIATDGGIDASTGDWFMGQASSALVGAFRSQLKIRYDGGSTQYGILLRPTQNANTNALVFKNAADTIIGTISQTTTGVAYNVSSDYRLKDEIGGLVSFSIDAETFDYLPDVLLRVMAARPISYTWKSEPDSGIVHGFLAHELQQVFPHAVTGEKDAVEDVGTVIIPQKIIPAVKDDDGNVVSEQFVVPKDTIPNTREQDTPEGATWKKTGQRAITQMVDHSKLVPDLLAANQALTVLVIELRQAIAALDARLAELEQ